MASSPDISRIISLIMENPQLVEQISNLAKSETNESKEEAQNPQESTSASVSAEPIMDHNAKSNTRSQLLRAMKPYVNEERSKAIESMITIADILLSVKEK